MKTMKYFLPIIVAILLSLSLPINSNCQQGWFQQVSGTTLNLNSVYFIDANTGFVSADGGFILKTTNSGTNWMLINTGANTKLYQIVFVNSATGFAGTDINTIRSTNGGINWNTSIINGGRSISFINQTIGYALNPNLLSLYKTSNSGLNWFFVGYILVGQGGAFKICFRNENTGYAGGFARGIYSTYSVFIDKTTNSGINWVTVGGGTPSYGTFLTDLFFLNDSYGFALEHMSAPVNYYFYKTTNAGQNWVKTSLPQEINSVRFTDVNSGWTCGDNGGILYTSNGGTNWISQISNVTTSLNSVYMLNLNTGWIVGNNGVILKTTNGGVTGIEPISNQIPSQYKLEQNYPNPFNPGTKICFSIPTPLHPPFSQRGEGEAGGFVKLIIYDILGREAAVLVNQQLKPGTYEVQWDGSNYPSGVYVYRLETGSFNQTKKMLLIK